MGNNVNTTKCILRLHRICRTDSGNNPRKHAVFPTIYFWDFFIHDPDRALFCEIVIAINTFTLYKISLIQEKTAAEMATFLKIQSLPSFLLPSSILKDSQGSKQPGA